jgi:hypothetical protein
MPNAWTRKESKNPEGGLNAKSRINLALKKWDVKC